ncbi:hypothetical protein GE115_09600 [Agromyces sp. CFH 90414]|uniref:Uncharacterized protein n=1 Tax=Agromyces agglutinans TaxID=2662258 RepID=A0A6I2FE16_9MICO|nr:hypothetical protein [Agromyces agglutinans]MRG60123.1 hypothetical protein [Agromyces agglutinans]
MSEEPMNGWTDEDDALVAYESLPDWHPALFVDVFRTGLEMEHPDKRSLLAGAFITPESLEFWGDFSRARAVFATRLKISMTAMYGVGAPDVAYVRLVETDEHINHDLYSVIASMHVTLVWRPEIAILPNSAWRIHHLGEAIEPTLVPRTQPGFDPRTQP